MSGPLSYTIGWVCAILVEYTAAQQFLDEVHDLPDFERPHGDENSYAFGKIGKHNVVIAVLPNGQYGTNIAAAVVRDMLRSFGGLKLGVMVGVGGGAPLLESFPVNGNAKLKRDIRLGDIVVSTPGDGESGVYQYDYGKAIQGRKFQETGHLNSPPRSVLSAVTSLRSKIEQDGHTIMQDINTALDKKPRLRSNYQRPAQATDLLFRSSCVHPVDADQPCSEVCALSEDNLVARTPRTELQDDPAIHYGLIASANKLMKDARARDALAEEKGVLCFEMEAAGLMNQLPFLVIRGICDYSDSHKNKAWRGYAAMTAAAYTRQLLLELAPWSVEAERKLSSMAGNAMPQNGFNNTGNTRIGNQVNGNQTIHGGMSFSM